MQRSCDSRPGSVIFGSTDFGIGKAGAMSGARVVGAAAWRALFGTHIVGNELACLGISARATGVTAKRSNAITARASSDAFSKAAHVFKKSAQTEFFSYKDLTKSRPSTLGAATMH